MSKSELKRSIDQVINELHAQLDPTRGQQPTTGAVDALEVHQLAVSLITDTFLRWELDRSQTVGEIADIFLKLLDQLGYAIVRKETK